MANRPFEPMSDEEVIFCWRTITERGNQLSIAQLQHFMLEVLGEPIPETQAADLLEYMDANCDGRVGLDDFRNFMSVTRLADTDAKNFMWAPKAKYRREHGLAKERPGSAKRLEEEAATEFERQLSLDLDVLEDLRSVRSQGSSLDMLAGIAEDGRPHPRALPHELDAALEGVVTSTPTPPPLPPPVGRSPGPSRRSVRSTVSSRQRSVAPEPASPLEPPRAVPERPRAPLKAIDPKSLAKINSALEKYEKAFWERFLREEEECNRRIFAQGAASDTGDLGALELHRLLTRWLRHCKWCMPADLRPADSLAMLERMAGGSAADVEAECRLTYRAWMDMVRSTRRVEDPPA